MSTLLTMIMLYTGPIPKEDIEQQHYKYECTVDGVKRMLLDGLEDETIKEVCK